MLVYVLKQNGQPFMPTTRFGKIRRLLKTKKAKVVRKEPFTIKLLYEPETDVVQECYCGVDTGSRHIGVAVVSNDKVLYQSQTELRNNIKRKMDARRACRRNRRSRKTRYRKPRFLNRGNSTKSDRLPPSVKHKVQAHIDEIEFCKKILPISDSNLIIEVSQFDTALMKDPSLISEKVKHWGYQQGFNYGYSSRREAILYRDNYTCQCCGKKKCRLEVHHIKFKRNGGTDDEENLITLCEGCHRGVHAGTVVLSKKPKKSKDHFIDACVVASGGLEFKELNVIFYKNRIPKGDYQLTKGIRGEQKLSTGKICGFRKFDKVEYLGEKCFIKGRMSSGFAILMDIFGNKIDFTNMPRGMKTPKLSNCKQISARSSYLYISQIRKERAIPVLS